MLAKVAVLFIVFMMVLGMFGKLRVPKIGQRKPPLKCKNCGAFLIGKSPCTCQKKQK